MESIGFLKQISANEQNPSKPKNKYLKKVIKFLVCRWTLDQKFTDNLYLVHTTGVNCIGKKLKTLN